MLTVAHFQAERNTRQKNHRLSGYTEMNREATFKTILTHGER